VSQDQQLDALGNRTRRTIFDGLRSGPRSVGEIAAELPVSRPAVSQHLKALREAGLVTVETDGTRRLYSIDPQGIEVLRQFVETMWDDVLARFEKAALKQGGTND
jgi:DNA-binding transcriptional ArsR family regulator